MLALHGRVRSGVDRVRGQGRGAGLSQLLLESMKRKGERQPRAGPEKGGARGRGGTTFSREEQEGWLKLLENYDAARRRRTGSAGESDLRGALDKFRKPTSRWKDDFTLKNRVTFQDEDQRPVAKDPWTSARFRQEQRVLDEEEDTNCTLSPIFTLFNILFSLHRIF